MGIDELDLGNDTADTERFGGWTIELDSDGCYSLFEPSGLRAAPVYWDSRGRCWAGWESPEDGEGVHFCSPVYGTDLESLMRLLAAAAKPDGIKPREPRPWG